jgi:hypothetical protein
MARRSWGARPGCSPQRATWSLERRHRGPLPGAWLRRGPWSLAPRRQHQQRGRGATSSLVTAVRCSGNLPRVASIGRPAADGSMPLPHLSSITRLRGVQWERSAPQDSDPWVGSMVGSAGCTGAGVAAGVSLPLRSRRAVRIAPGACLGRTQGPARLPSRPLRFEWVAPPVSTSPREPPRSGEQSGASRPRSLWSLSEVRCLYAKTSDQRTR